MMVNNQIICNSCGLKKHCTPIYTEKFDQLLFINKNSKCCNNPNYKWIGFSEEQKRQILIDKYIASHPIEYWEDGPYKSVEGEKCPECSSKVIISIRTGSRGYRETDYICCNCQNRF